MGEATVTIGPGVTRTTVTFTDLFNGKPPTCTLGDGKLEAATEWQVFHVSLARREDRGLCGKFTLAHCFPPKTIELGRIRPDGSVIQLDEVELEAGWLASVPRHRDAGVWLGVCPDCMVCVERRRRRERRESDGGKAERAEARRTRAEARAAKRTASEARKAAKAEARRARSEEAKVPRLVRRQSEAARAKAEAAWLEAAGDESAILDHVGDEDVVDDEGEL